MKKLKRALALCAITVLVIAAIFTLTACNKDPQVESISVQIIGGGTKIELTQEDATVAKIKGKINVVANLSDETTKPITDYTVEGFDATKLDVAQTVKIKYESFEDTVSVEVKSASPVVEPQIVSIAVTFEGTKITLQQATASEAAVLAQITVTATYDDQSTKTLTEGVTLEGFSATTLDTDQSVKAKYGAIKSNEFTVLVVATPVVEPQIVSIAVAIKDGGEKVTLPQGASNANALLAKITVTATLDNGETKPVTTGLEFKGFSPATLDTDQSVKVIVGKIESNEFTVRVVSTQDPTPDEDEVLIKINDDEATAMTVDPENENKYLSGDVTLAHGDVVVITLNGEPVAFDGGESFTATYIGVHTFTVTVGDDGATIAVTAPATSYAIALKVGDNAEETPEAVSGVYTWTLTLNRGDVVTISDNMFGDLKIAGATQYTATRSGSHTITATPGATATTVAVNQPALVVTLTVTRGDEVVNTLTRDTQENGQYVFMGVELKENDTVVISNNAGVTYTYEEWSQSEWNKVDGVATEDGNYDFYAKGSNEVYVAYHAPVDLSKVVTIVVNGTTSHELTLDEAKNEYSITLELEADDTVKILVNGEEINPNYENSFNGTATVAGSYEFYVKENSTWVTMPANAIQKPVKVYFYNHGWTDNWETVNAYCWKEATESSPKKENAGWPGEAMEDIGDGWFAINLEEGYEKIIFKGGNQTGDLILEVVDGVAYYDPFGVYTGTERPNVQ